MLPLAAGLSLTVGAFWWTLTLRQEMMRPATLQDQGRSWVIGAANAPALPTEWPAELRAAVAETLVSGRLQIAPWAAAWLEPGESYAARRSARADLFRLGGPQATAVPEGRPLFYWRPVEGATSYRIEIAQASSEAVVQVADVSAPAIKWTPPEPLPLGEIYSWRVKVRRGEEILTQAPAENVAPAKFRVLNAKKRQQWERERTLAGESSLLRGIVAARAGLLEEAAEEFRALGRQNPRAERARLLLEQVETASAR